MELRLSSGQLELGPGLSLAKEENSKLKKEFKVQVDLINELNNRIDFKDAEIQKMRSEMNWDKCEFQAETSAHEKIENFACTICEFKSEKEYDLVLQISSNHPLNYDKKCEFAAEGKDQVGNLKKFLWHLSVEHFSGTKIFKCSDFLYTTKKLTKTRKCKKLSIH